MQGSWVRSLVGELRSHGYVVWQKKKISFISKTKHGLRDSGLGFGEREAVWRHRAQWVWFPLLWCPLFMPKSELEACFLLERVSGPASAPWLDQQVWFDLGLLTNHLLLPTLNPSMPPKVLLQADQPKSLSRLASVPSGVWRTGVLIELWLHFWKVEKLLFLRTICGCL